MFIFFVFVFLFIGKKKLERILFIFLGGVMYFDYLFKRFFHFPGGVGSWKKMDSRNRKREKERKRGKEE